MDFWEKIKSDIQKGIKDGIGIVKEGAIVVKTKAEELTEEGKKRLKVFELKTKVQRDLSELGGKVYALSAKGKNPLFDSKVKAVITRVNKAEARIAKLEGKKAASGKTGKKQTLKSKRK
jgi:hypothetical protein